MLITSSTLAALQNGFNTAFQQGFNALGSNASTFEQVVMTVPSTHKLENYGWMKDLPGVREWVGQRQVNNLESTGMQLVNRDWEHTIGVDRNDIEDDALGVYTLALQQQGEIVARHPNSLVWQTILAGFTALAYDGQYFFDTDHVGYTSAGAATTFSNYQSGAGTPWILMDLSRTYMRPFIYQVRKAPQFVAKSRPDDDNVFLDKKFVYGADARYNAGYGFFQLAGASKATLDATNYNSLRVALTSQYRPDGSSLGVRPTHIAVGPSNLAAARTLFAAQTVANGGANIWFNDAQIIEVPELG